MKQYLFLPLLFVFLTPGMTVARAETPKQKCGFLQNLKKWMVGEDLYTNNFAFAPEELSKVSSFLNTADHGIQLTGINERAIKLQDLVLKRYAKKLNPEEINAFGTLDEFRMSDGNLRAEVSVKTVGQKLQIELANVYIKSVGSTGNNATNLNLSVAKFFATVRKGLEYRLSLAKDVTSVELTSKNVMNGELKKMLSELGFTKTFEMPSFGVVKGFEGREPLANFKMDVGVTRSETH